MTELLTAPEPRRRIVAVQALAKGDRSELAIEMLTEAGVAEIIPVDGVPLGGAVVGRAGGEILVPLAIHGARGGEAVAAAAGAPGARRGLDP